MKNTVAKIRFFFIILLVCVGFFSCVPDETFPPETVLEFNRVQFWVHESNRDSVVGMSILINFQDGDGNIGFLGRDTTYNLFVHVFDSIFPPQGDATFVPMQISHNNGIDWENWVRSFAVPDLGSGSVRGTFDVGFFGDFNILQRSDLGVVRFEIYMYDRDSVRSNIVTTPGIRIP
ncbi:MAG: hypothetical protein FWC94_04230 [Bacteroidales bacterium]|nr:hypothetical protein [Bacteroidales bacterium]